MTRRRRAAVGGGVAVGMADARYLWPYVPMVYFLSPIIVGLLLKLAD